jgi:hypothetical protein
MDSGWREYQRTLAKELGDELAQEFVGSLRLQSRGCVKTATQFFHGLGLRWSPLMHAWSKWVERNAQGTIAIILRDAKPLTALSRAKSWKQVYLNRLICGVPDELSGDAPGKQQPLLKRYLGQCGCAEYFTFVDSGCYGTVVLELHKLGMSFRPLFFFSKNPNIRGFLNEIGVSMAEGEILNDSLECGFPHIYARPSELVEINRRVGVVLRPSDSLSVKFGKAAMRGVSDARVGSDVSAREAARAVLRLSQKARRGEFTGVLGHASPEWSKKKEFLANWPKHLRWA